MAADKGADTFDLRKVISEGALSWAVGKVLDGMLVVIRRELKPIEQKLNKLLHAPFETAERTLELAKRYPERSDEQMRELGKAKDLFNSG